jgi:AraC-like DNA-binding protein
LTHTSGSLPRLRAISASAGAPAPFRTQIVSEQSGRLSIASGVTVDVERGVEELDTPERRSSLAERTFKRRFTSATGLTPIAYVQRLRIEDAKRRLERTEASVDEISWQVGYEDAAFFQAFVQAHDRPRPGRLSQALPHAGLRCSLTESQMREQCVIETGRAVRCYKSCVAQ